MSEYVHDACPCFLSLKLYAKIRPQAVAVHILTLCRLVVSIKAFDWFWSRQCIDVIILYFHPSYKLLPLKMVSK